MSARHGRGRTRISIALATVGAFCSLGLASVVRSRSEPRNRRLTDVVAASNAALRLAFCEPLPGLALLVWGEGGLAAEFDTLGLRIGTAARGALCNAPAFQRGSDAKHSEDEFGKVRGRIDNRLGKRTQP